MRRMHHPEQPGQELDSRSVPAPRTGERFQDQVVSAVAAAHKHAREPAEPRHGGREIGRDGIIAGVHGGRRYIPYRDRMVQPTDGRIGEGPGNIGGPK